MDKNKPTVPRIRCIRIPTTEHRASIQPDDHVATAEHAASTGRVDMSTRPTPERCGAVVMATQRCPRLKGTGPNSPTQQNLMQWSLQSFLLVWVIGTKIFHV